MESIRYDNIIDLNIDQLMTDLYFRGYLFQHSNVKTLKYDNQDSIIYVNYDTNTQNLITDLNAINPNVKYFFTNKHTLCNTWKLIPNFIQRVYLGDMIIDDYPINKYTYYGILCDNDNEIYDYLNQYPSQIDKMITIKNHFGENCIYNMVVNKCFRSIQFIIYYLKITDESKLANILNEVNINNKTLYSHLLEFNFTDVEELFSYITDTSLNTLDNNNSSILWESANKNKIDLVRKIIPRVSQKILETRDVLYNTTPLSNLTETEYCKILMKDKLI